jgi:hypothetical protein
MFASKFFASYLNSNKLFIEASKITTSKKLLFSSLDSKAKAKPAKKQQNDCFVFSFLSKQV